MFCFVLGQAREQKLPKAHERVRTCMDSECTFPFEGVLVVPGTPPLPPPWGVGFGHKTINN